MEFNEYLYGIWKDDNAHYFENGQPRGKIILDYAWEDWINYEYQKNFEKKEYDVKLTRENILISRLVDLARFDKMYKFDFDDYSITLWNFNKDGKVINHWTYYTQEPLASQKLNDEVYNDMLSILELNK
jgi:hypothetical protein